jgi:hypothetical protein
VPPANGVDERQEPGDHVVDDGIVDTPLEEHAAHGHDNQHGTMDGHIAPVQENVEVVGVWTAPRTNKKPGRITDVWSQGDFAYLGTFAPPCSGLGVNVVDISDPENPKKAAFIPSRPGTRVNDVKVIHLETSAFTGDVLLHSNENCSAHPQRVGGISLWDVTDPTNAQPLARGVGEYVRALAPLAAMTASAVRTVPSDSSTRKGWAESSTLATTPFLTSAPNCLACSFIRLISSGPVSPSGNPG